LSEVSDDWRPNASIETLRKRAEIIAEIRTFFTGRGYLEVETPIMAAFGVTDVYLENLKVDCMGKTYALQTSPEYHMKRLLAAGSGPIFQIFKAFRDDESGRWHHPEFSMLEWYQPGMTVEGILEEINALFQALSIPTKLKVYTYQALFETYLCLNPFTVSISELKSCLNKQDLSHTLNEDEQDIDQYLFLLMSYVIEPELAKETAPIAVTDFPISQASLARIEAGRAKRFEVYYQGIELANGFDELTDADEQLARFKHDQAIRKQKGLTVPEIDTRLVSALQSGLPESCGIALGLDRLVALLLQQDNLKAVTSFSN